ncbi:MAG TPA: 30S ribosomal protein S6 [Ktedonobacteraceae bacterium]|nr:30S ribosomal protein S6 [Ktedonobacteraceae bacterium]
MRRDYELGFILNPEVSEEQTRTILERVEQVVTNHGGQVVRVNQWGRRRLGYPIQHHRDGFYVFVDMILTPDSVAELDRTLKVSEEVLRHLIKRRDPKTVQKEREEREARAAAAAATPPSAPPNAQTEQPEEQETPVDNDVVNNEVEAPSGLSAGDIEDEDVPPAIEEEIIEA